MTSFQKFNSLLTPANLLKAIIITNIFMFVVSLTLTGSDIKWTLKLFEALAPSSDSLTFLGASGRFPIIKFEAWWSLITANWLHGSLFHLLGNTICLLSIAPLIMKEFGIYRMFSIYTLTGVSGFLLSYIGNVHITIGASSGLFGLIGAGLYFGKSRGDQWGNHVFKQIATWIVIFSIISFFIPKMNHWCHAGGLFSGIFFGWVMGYNDQRRENYFDMGLGVFWAMITIWLLSRSAFKGLYLTFS